MECNEGERCVLGQYVQYRESYRGLRGFKSGLYGTHFIAKEAVLNQRSGCVSIRKRRAGQFKHSQLDLSVKFLVSARRSILLSVGFIGLVEKNMYCASLYNCVIKYNWTVEME